MMARSHALSAAATWTALAATAAAIGHPWQPATVTVGAVVCAGAALLPDIDCPDSHAARSFGPPSRAAARGIAALSIWVYARTATVLDRPDSRGGHRGVTHSLLFAAVVGALVSALAYTRAGRGTAVVVLFVAATWTGRALLSWRGRHVTVGSGKWRIRIPWAPFAGAVAAAVLLHYTPDAADWAWLGAPVALGAALHSLGDTPAHHRDADPAAGGIALLWPLRINGQRWYRVRPPVSLMFPVDGFLEHTWALGFAVTALASLGFLVVSA